MSEEKRPAGAELVAGSPLPGEDRLEETLRPTRLEDFIGQDRVKANLRVFIEATRKRGEALDYFASQDISINGPAPISPSGGNANLECKASCLAMRWPE